MKSGFNCYSASKHIHDLLITKGRARSSRPFPHGLLSVRAHAVKASFTNLPYRFEVCWEWLNLPRQRSKFGNIRSHAQFLCVSEVPPISQICVLCAQDITYMQCPPPTLNLNCTPSKREVHPLLNIKCIPSTLNLNYTPIHTLTLLETNLSRSLPPRREEPLNTVTGDEVIYVIMNKFGCC